MSTAVQANPAPIVASPFAQLESGLSSAQQAVPIPIVRGTQKVALVSASVVYNLNAQPTPSGKTKK